MTVEAIRNFLADKDGDLLFYTQTKKDDTGLIIGPTTIVLHRAND